MDNNDFSSLQEKVRDVLLKDWDPIGGGVPDDEYDQYIPRVCRMLMEKKSKEELKNHLINISQEDMGLGKNENLAELAAGKLVNLNI